MQHCTYMASEKLDWLWQFHPNRRQGRKNLRFVM